MTLLLGLRVLTVAAMGWVVAHAVRSLVDGLRRSPKPNWREMMSEVLSGLGALGIGWGWLPGGTAVSEDALVLGGTLLFALGLLVAQGRSAH